MRHRTNPWLSVVCGTSVAIFVCNPVSHAAGGIATDGTVGGPGALGHPQTLGGSRVTITEDLGSRAGKNLFHSFSEFNVATGQTVTFTENAPNSLDHVITRVTGRTASDIDGKLQSTPGGHADFYLINPSGVTFGRGAQIDVPGDFHVSTADHLKFKDGARFSATNPNASTLTSAGPAAFGFLGTSKATNGLLKVEGARLEATPGKTLDAVAGKIEIEAGGNLAARAGEIRLAAARGKTEVSVEKPTPKGNLPLPTTVPSGKNAGEIAIRGTGNKENTQNGLDTSGDGGGRIGIWGGKVSFLEGSRASADNGSSIHAGPNQGVFIKARNLKVENASISAQAVNGTGKSGDISTESAGDTAIVSGGVISATTFSAGNAGDVRVTARGRLTIDGTRYAGFTGITAQADEKSKGSAGNVYVESGGDMTIAEFGQIVSATQGSGPGGRVTVKTGGTLVIDARGKIELVDRQGKLHKDVLTGIGTGTQYKGIEKTANAGNVLVESQGTIIVRDSGEISSFTSGSGKAGSVTVNAARLIVDGNGSNINAQAYTEDSSGKTGNVRIAATKGIDISNFGKLSVENKSARNQPGIRPGHMTVTAPEIMLSSRGEISSHSFRSLDAADIRLSGKTVSLQNAGILTTVEKGKGNGGNIEVLTDTLLMETGVIEANAESGKGGNVTLNVQALVASGNTLNGREVSTSNPLNQSSIRQEWHADQFGSNVIQAVSAIGLGGKITLSNPQLNLSGVLANLGNPAFEVEEIDEDYCKLETGSNLSVQGRGGLPPKGSDLILF